MAILPGRLAIATFSPRLDEQGNSVRGVAVCRDLSSRLNLHLVRPGEQAASPIRTSLTLAQISSKRGRPLKQRLVLERVGYRALVFELQGELGFSAVELLARRVEETGTEVESVVIDLRRITGIDPGGATLLRQLGSSLKQAGARFALSGLRKELADQLDGIDRFAELDRALEWCEDSLLTFAGLDLGQRSVERPTTSYSAACRRPISST